MGAFYTNVTVRPAALDDVMAALTKLGRDAFMAPGGNDTVVVFDAATESQDAREIETFVESLSKRLRCTAFAVLNHDDDLLHYALFDGGHLVDEYNSSPGYFEGESDAPSGGDAEVLCRAFDAPERAADVARILHEAEYTFATERHAELVEALGLPECAVGFGYESITSGEPLTGAYPLELRTVGVASIAHRPTAAAAPPTVDDTTLAKLKAMVRPSPELAAVVGPAPLPHGLVVMKVISYITRHALSDPVTRSVRADAALRAVYGSDRLTFEQLGIGLDAHLTPVEPAGPAGAP